MVVALSVVYGAVIGSFLNVLTYRLPRGESLVSPASHCPNCGSGVKPYDNIPIFGWLLLRGRCRSCAEPISARYPIVEAVTTLLAVTVVLTKHSAHDVALGLVLSPAASSARDVTQPVVDSWSGGAGPLVRLTNAALSPMFPAAEVALTVRMLVNLVGVTVTLAEPSLDAATLWGAAPLSW